MRIILIIFLLIATPCFGAEFNIMRYDKPNTEPSEQNSLYKRGDIINVQPDGFYSDKPHMTILAVPGLDHKKVVKFIEERYELVDVTVELNESEFQKAKDSTHSFDLNDKNYTVYLGRYVQPVLISYEDGIRKYSAKELKPFSRRRFNIPGYIMDNLFPEGVYRRTVSKEVFLKHVKKIRDKTFNLNVENTQWYADFSSGL